MEFKYQAKSSSGQFLEGNIEAPDQDTAVNILHGKGYVLLSFESIEKSFFSVDISQLIQPNQKDLIIFTRQLSTLIDANMPLAESLHVLAKQLEKPTFRKIVLAVADAVEGGASLSSALSSHSRLFSPFYVKLVKSGETTGKLQESLAYLADYLERSDAINSKLRGALTYPIFIVFAMIVVGVIMAVYVLPQLLQIFKDSGITNLPLTTRILIGIVNLTDKYLFYFLALSVAGAFFIWKYVKTPQGIVVVDNLKIKIPRVGIVIRNLYLARMAESLSTLIKAQIPILDALKIASEIVGNANYERVLLASVESVRGGGNISTVFAEYSEIPSMMTSMVAIGERTGKVDTMLEHVSKFYKSEAENSIANFTQIIEPILILVLGIGVAGLVSSILLPIYSLVSAG